MKTIDVTDQVHYTWPDDESLPITKCVCGATFPAWEFTISIYADQAYQCPNCGRKLFYRNAIKVFEVQE